MDKFVTKKERVSNRKKVSPKKTSYKQTTIESLKVKITAGKLKTKKKKKGVVVIEEVKRLKAKLVLEGTSNAELVECLGQLGKKIPPRHVMMETKIGKVVNNLRKSHTDESVKKAARRVYVRWKTHFKDIQERPQIEVRCDDKTERLRTSARRLLEEALKTEGESNQLVEVIERETFHHFNRHINHAYRRHMRKLVFTLKNQSDVRTKVISGEISVSDFIQEKYNKS